MIYMRALPFAVSAVTLFSMLGGLIHTAASADTNHGDDMLAAYFRSETQKLNRQLPDEYPFR